MKATRLGVGTLMALLVACTSSPPPPTQLPGDPPPSSASPTDAAATPTPPTTPGPGPTPPPKIVGDLELEECDELGLMRCEHQAVTLTEPVAGTGVALTYSSEWADGRTDRPAWSAAPLGLGGWSLDVLHRYDADNGILLMGNGAWRFAEAVDIGGGERAVPASDGFVYFVFDSDWRHVRSIDAVTGITLVSFEYDSAGRLAMAFGDIGQRHVDLSVRRSETGTPVAITGAETTTTLLATDEHGGLGLILRPDGTTLSISSANFGLVQKASHSGRGDIEFEYDSSGRLARAIDADGVAVALAFESADGTATITRSYGESGTARLTMAREADTIRRTLIDRDETVLELVADADGGVRLTAPDGTVTDVGAQAHPTWGMSAPVRTPFVRTRPDGAVYRFEASTTMGTGSPNPAGGEWRSEYVGDGQTYVTTYDPATRTLTDADPAGRQLVRVFDDRARLLEQRRPGSPTLTYAYDAAGRPTSISVGGAVTTYAYDTAAGTVTETRPDGTIHTSSYDNFGSLLRAASQEENVSLIRDASGNVVQVRTGAQPATSIGYSPSGRETAFIPVAVGDDSSYELTTYTADGLVASITGPGSRSIAIDYDASARPQSWTFDRGTSTASYDPQTGLLRSNASPDGVGTSFGYLGAVQVGLDWSGPVEGQVQRDLNALLQPTTETVNEIDAISFGYDTSALLISIDDVALEREAATGLLASSSLGNAQIANEYDSNGRLIATTATFGGDLLITLRYTRDVVGRVTRLERVSAAGGSSTTDYTYDATGRLVRAAVDGEVQSYTYDETGNRTEVSDAAGAVQATFDDRDRLVTNGDDTFAYESDGTLLSRVGPAGSTSFDFDDLGALRSVTLADGARVEYILDAGGRRMGRLLNGELTDGFIYNVDDKIVAWTDGAGTVRARFAYDDGGRLTLVRLDGRDLLVVADHLGSPIALLDSETGEIVQEWSLDAWGSVVTDGGDPVIPFGMAGGLVDPDTGLVHFGARDYDPTVGRWTAPDPLRFAGGDINLYRYAGGDPVNFVDPTGLAFGLPGVGGAGYGQPTPYRDTGPTGGARGSGSGGTAAGGGVAVDVGPAKIDEGYEIDVGPAKVEDSYAVDVGPAEVESSAESGGGSASDSGGGLGGGSQGGSGGDSGGGPPAPAGGGPGGASTGAPAGGPSGGSGGDGGASGGSSGGGGSGGGGTTICIAGPCVGPGGPQGAVPGSPASCIGLCVPPTPVTSGVCLGACGGGSEDQGWACILLCFFGEPHLLTADQVDLDFQAAGEFIVTASADESLEIQARFETSGNSTTFTRGTAIAVQVLGDRVGFYADAERPMIINGEVIERADYATTLPSGAIIERHGTDAVVRWPDGSFLGVHVYPRFVNMAFMPSDAVATTLVGILGAKDGDRSNDLTTRDGLVIDQGDPDFTELLYGDFANSWRISQEESLFDYLPGQSTAAFQRPDIPTELLTVDDLSADVRSEAEALCRAVGVTTNAILSDCVFDVGMTGDSSYAASAAMVELAHRRAAASPDAPGTGITVGETVEGQLIAGATDRYELSVEAGQIIYLDALGECSGDMWWRLMHPDGALSAFDRVCTDLARRVLATEGSWAIEIYSDSGTATGPYSFSVIDVPQPQLATVTPGQTITGATEAIGEQHRYTLTVNEGDTLYFDALGECADDLDWRLLRPNGGLTAFSDTCQDIGRRQLDVAGEWAIEIYADGTGTGAYSFTVIAVPPTTVAPLTLDQQVTGATDAVGAWHRYTIDAEGGDVVFLDALGDCVPELYWRLVRPNGGLTAFAETCIDMGRRVLDEPGQWAVEVYSDTMAFGAYSFTAMSVPRPREDTIAMGQTVSGQIASIGEWHRYSFAGTADQRVFLDALGQCQDDLWWRLLGPDGALTAFANVCTDMGEVALDESGNWAIEIYSDGVGTGPYSVALQPAP